MNAFFKFAKQRKTATVAFTVDVEKPRKVKNRTSSETETAANKKGSLKKKPTLKMIY